MSATIIGGTVSPSTALTINQQTGTSYTFLSADQNNVLVEASNAAAITITIPPDSTTNFPIGTQINVVQTGAGQVTIAAGLGVTLNGTPGLKTRAQWSVCSAVKRASNLWLLTGDIVA